MSHCRTRTREDDILFFCSYASIRRGPCMIEFAGLLLSYLFFLFNPFYLRVFLLFISHVPVNAVHVRSSVLVFGFERKRSLFCCLFPFLSCFFFPFISPCLYYTGTGFWWPVLRVSWNKGWATQVGQGLCTIFPRLECNVNGHYLPLKYKQ